MCELSQCPFCGGVASLARTHASAGWYVCCTGEGCEAMVRGRTANLVSRRWNRRVLAVEVRVLWELRSQVAELLRLVRGKRAERVAG